jgi:hypothetical protein
MSEQIKGRWIVRGRVNQPTAGILHGLSDDDWGLVIWIPCPPFVMGQVGAVVCTRAIPPEDAKAIADRMAAAPELYEALKELVSITDRKHDAWDRARAALAKADGKDVKS